MSRNQKDEVPRPRGKPDEPLRDANKTVERDRRKVPVQPTEPERRPAERPDLDWAEHED
jgi:hypothetical protein